MLLNLNEGHFDLFLIEGKKQSSGFRADCNSNLTYTRELSINPKIFDYPVIVTHKGAKGGFVKIHG